MTTGPFTGRTLADTVERLRSGAGDPVDLVDATLDAIAAAQPVLNAFVTVDAEGARKAARAARDEPPRGPLHGVPVAVKAASRSAASKPVTRFHNARYGDAGSCACNATTRRTASPTSTASRPSSICRASVARLS